MLKVGDRVSRQIELFKPERRYGKIVKIYRSRQGCMTTPIKLYDIKWDNVEEIGLAYFEVSLQKET